MTELSTFEPAHLILMWSQQIAE